MRYDPEFILNKNQLADVLGLHEQTVLALIKKGLPILSLRFDGRGKRYLFDVKAVIKSKPYKDYCKKYKLKPLEL